MIAGCLDIKTIIKQTGVKRSALYKMEAAKVIKFYRFPTSQKVYIKLEELENALK